MDRIASAARRRLLSCRPSNAIFTPLGSFGKNRSTAPRSGPLEPPYRGGWSRWAHLIPLIQVRNRDVEYPAVHRTAAANIALKGLGPERDQPVRSERRPRLENLAELSLSTCCAAAEAPALAVTAALEWPGSLCACGGACLPDFRNTSAISGWRDRVRPAFQGRYVEEVLVLAKPSPYKQPASFTNPRRPSS